MNLMHNYHELGHISHAENCPILENYGFFCLFESCTMSSFHLLIVAFLALKVAKCTTLESILHNSSCCGHSQGTD